MAKKYKVGRIKENFVGTGTSSVAATGDDPTVAISVEKLKQLRKKNYEPMPLIRRQG
jgi:hypothetical protein